MQSPRPSEVVGKFTGETIGGTAYWSATLSESALIQAEDICQGRWLQKTSYYDLASDA